MSADLLREAAAKMRSDWPLSKFCPADCNCEQDGATYHPDAETFVAVANWLEVEAAETNGPNGMPSLEALDVARSYLRPTD